MPRYFFDTRDNDALIIDDEGVELADLGAVKAQAARSLAELALDLLPESMRRKLSVHVRDASDQPIMLTELTFEARVFVELPG